MKKRKSKQKFKSLSEATPEEMTKAFKMAGLWITGELMGQTEEGAFSEAFLGEPAVEYFPKRAFLKLNDPETKWKWKEGTKLSTLMINVMKSEMGHVLEKFEAQGMPDVKAGVNGNCECSIFGKIECSVFRNSSTSFSVTMMQHFS